MSTPNLSLLLGAGEEKARGTLQVAVLPSNAYDLSLTYSSSDETVVMVSEDGSIQAIGTGKATISAVSNDNPKLKPVISSITVSKAVESLTLGDIEEILYVTKKAKLEATVLPEDAGNNTVVWTSSDATIASVDKTGLVTAKKAGKVTITCSAGDGSEVAASKTIQVINVVSKLTFPQKSLTLVLGGEEAASRTVLDYTLTPENAYYQDVVWSSSDESVATVNQDGLVQALAAGTATIKATTTDPASKASSTCTVTVGQAVNLVSITGAETTVMKGSKKALKVSVLPADALNQKVTWSR